MKNLRKITTIVTILALSSATAFAGNEDRAGEAGASQILVNPWARSSGWGGANSTSVRGLEAISLNVAGLAHNDGTELIFSNVNYLSGTDIKINSFGLAQKVGESGVIGLSASIMSFGDIKNTTVENPEGGGIGQFSPSYLNIGISYAKIFSNSIYAGGTVKLISQSTANVKASGIAIDLGVKYITGKYDQIQFGITLRNAGPAMSFSGNGLSVTAKLPASPDNQTLSFRTAPYELPVLVNIGASYDFYLSGVDTANDGVRSLHRLTAAGTFTSNSFTKDQIRIGAEYAFKEMFMFRGGFVYEKGNLSEQNNTTANVGPTAGASIAIPFGKSNSKIALDYSYRVTRSFNGTHSIGLRLNL